MQYLEPESIEEMHIEITNNCNAACPMCARNIFGGQESVPKGLSEWKEEDIYRVFNNELINLKNVFICGTHGDPLIANSFLRVVEVLKYKNISVDIFTNGSLRNDNWWIHLVSLLGEKDRITFGVDGIKTHHLYRKKTNISKILDHTKIACNGKVRVRWDFLAFKHNEHELRECQYLAKDLGVSDFRVRRTARFSTYNPWPVLNKENQITHYLELPTTEELRHPSFSKLSQVTTDLTDKEELNKAILRKQEMSINRKNKQLSLEHTMPYKISCMYRNANKLYVNSRLDVFPCSFIGDTTESVGLLTKDELAYPEGELSLRNKTWKEVLAHPYYAYELVDSFLNKQVIPRCIKTCGIVKGDSNESRIYGQNLNL